MTRGIKFRVIVSLPGVGQVFSGIVRHNDSPLSSYVRETIETVLREGTLGMGWRTVSESGTPVDVQVDRLR